MLEVRADPRFFTRYVSSYYYICVLILLDMCPHTTRYVSSYYYICVLILLFTYTYMQARCFRRSSFLFLFFLFYPGPLLETLRFFLCPHTTIYVSA